MDESNLYLRLDFDSTPAFTSVELRTEEQIISVLDNPAIESAQGKILEIRIPFGVIGKLQFRIVLTNDEIPPDGWIEVGGSESVE